MTIPEAIAALQNDTENFLRTNILVISGAQDGVPAGPGYFTMSVRAAGGGGFLCTKAQPSVVPIGPNLLQAWYIPMEQIANMNVHRLRTAAESPLAIMLISQITACMFAVGRDGNNTTVAHFQPDQTAHMAPSLSLVDKIRMRSLTDENKLKQKAAELRQKDLRSDVRGAGLEAFAAQGKTYQAADTVAVVGIRGAGNRWTIFRQNVRSVSAFEKVISEVKST
jgi:hypothetical protein